MPNRTTPGLRPLHAAAIVLAATFGAPAFAQSPDMLQLRFAVADPNINPVTDSVIKLADTLGYYEKHGVDVEIIRLEGTPQAVAALNSGAVDVADISIDAVLRLKAENNVGLHGIVSATLGPPYLIATKTEITDLSGLVGRTYAIADNGSLDHNLTQHVLRNYGVDANGPQFVAIGPPAVRVQALAAGRIDATTVSYGTFLPIAATPGLHILLPPEDFFAAAPVQSKVIAALDTTIANKREALQRFVDAIVDMSRAYDTDPEAWVTAMAQQRDDLTVDNLRATTSLLVGRWCINGCMNLDYIGETVAFIYDSPDFANVPALNASDIIDESFVLDSLTRLGPYEGGGIDARP